MSSLRGGYLRCRFSLYVLTVFKSKCKQENILIPAYARELIIFKLTSFITLKKMDMKALRVKKKKKIKASF